MSFRMLISSCLLAAMALLHPVVADASDCDHLRELPLAHAGITEATLVAAGAFTAAGTDPAKAQVYARLPGFCRARGSSHPVADSHIRFEVWMPTSRWNGKLVGVGNGAWAGVFDYPAMAAALAEGYAVAGSDGGHEGSPLDAGFAAGHPEKLIDFGYRAVHEMTVAAKHVVDAYYDKPAERALFASCSTGGRQALMEAWRYPDDYDGISAMAPANRVPALMTNSLWIGNAVSGDPASRIPPEGFALAHRAALAQCDAEDGVRDGVISAPLRCDFDPATLRCGPGAKAGSCLSGPQVAALRAIYQGPRNPRTGMQIYPGFARGSENLLPVQASGDGPIAPAMSYFRDLVFADPHWDFRHFDYDRDFARALSAHGDITDVPPTGPDAYLAHGRKLLLSHGWADPLVSPMASIDFYRGATAALDAQAAANMRLFMIPGMGHCGGGSGPSTFDVLGVLDTWVETGRAPERIVVHNRPGTPSSTRPICAFPREALYRGRGNPDDQGSFRCGVAAPPADRHGR
jgi:hypothetical protein